MTNNTYVHKLTGCSPVPLASYLKALGILRLVSEQVDATAAGWWSGDVFHLGTTLDEAALCRFFRETYRPTPLVAPWNGGSGFFPKDNRLAMDALCNGSSERTKLYRDTIAACRSVLATLGLKEKPDGELKRDLLVACRAELPDEAVVSLDAAFVLTDDGPKYPPLLGTGFNDGRLEFTNNYMQRLLDLIDPQCGLATKSAAIWLQEAFFSNIQSDLQKDSILGQFDPGAVDRPVNPWDYVLMLEGALAFAASVVKRHESVGKGALSYPFCVRSAGIGYGSSANTDEGSSRAEIWLPLWSNPVTFTEIQAVLSEGRAQVASRSARNGVDFARAVSTLGTDRGIEQFVRYAFHARNGLAYFAVPIGRFNVEPQPQVNLLSQPELDTWLDNLRRAASSDNAPSGARRVLRRLEIKILELCQQRGASRLQSVLIALGEVEAVLVHSTKWRLEAFQRPVPLLPPKWLTDCDDATPEFRLAASLASIYSHSIGDFRQHVEPVEVKGSLNEGRPRWAEWSDDSLRMSYVAWNSNSLEDNLIAVLHRRITEAIGHGDRADDGTLVFPGQSLFSASLSDIESFLRHNTDDIRILELVRGLVLLDWGRVRLECGYEQLHRAPSGPMPDATFGLLKLCHSPWKVREKYVRLEPSIARLAASGKAAEATKHAARRMIGSGLAPAIQTVSRDSATVRRIAAALLFPVSWYDLNVVADTVLKSENVTSLAN